jgi:hypothetical protein
VETFEKVFTVHAHAESVLSLFMSEDKQLMFSSGVDSVVKVRLLIRLASLAEQVRFGLLET